MFSLSGEPAWAKPVDVEVSFHRYVEARLAELSNDHETAATIYAEKLKEQPDNALLAQKAYITGIETGDFPLTLAAVQGLQQDGSLGPEMPLVLFVDAYSRGDKTRTNDAIKLLEELKNFEFLAPLLRSWVATSSRADPSAALDTLKDHTTANYYYKEQLITHLYAMGSQQRAAPLVDDLVTRNEARMSAVRVFLARHHLAKKQPVRAMEILRFGSTTAERHLLERIEAGEYRGVGRKIDKRSGAAFLLQRLAVDLGAQQAAFLGLMMAQMAIELDPKSDYGQLVLGRRYETAGNYVFAVATFAELREESPYYLVALNAKIAALAKRENYGAAITAINDALKVRPELPELRILKGQILQLDGKYQQAVDIFSEAISLAETREYSDRTLANYWLSLGGAQDQADLWPDAFHSLKKADELQPGSATILNYLGYAQLERRENTAAAVEAIRQAYELRSSSPAITDSLGWAYYLTGEHEKAVGYLERALTGEPTDPTINEHLGDAYWTVGRKYEARYAWKSAKLFADQSDKDRLTTKIDLGLTAELVSP